MTERDSTKRGLRILVATDGSDQARLAVAAAVDFPWRDDSEVRAVVVQQGHSMYSPTVAAALQRGATLAAEDARRFLAKRWRDATAVVNSESPAKGVIDEAKALGADVIVMGWRGHGPVRRILDGSVSRNVIRQATCSVLVVRKEIQRAGEIVLGFDGSAEAQQAVQLLSKLSPTTGRVTIVRVADQVPVPGHALVSSKVMATVREEVKRINAEKAAHARIETKHAADALKEAGWNVRTAMKAGAPLKALLTMVEEAGADLLVIGARGTSGLRQVLLGSVVEGALNQCPVSLLIAR
jgi:nucleotide-binding universal stress UspA family protein